MNYEEDWKALCARFDGLNAAAQGYAQLRMTEKDSFSIGKEIADQCKAAVGALKEFLAAHGSALPPSANEELARFLQIRIVKAIETGERDVHGALAFPAALAGFAAGLSHLLHNSQETLRGSSVRAFEHLQRLLVVDPNLQQSWKDAFEDGTEVAVERLGGTHLLWHGIFGYKISSSGAATDLVFPEKFDASRASQVSIGLVLTEWKIVKEAKRAKEIFMAAKRQTDLYKGGLLASTELRNYRFLVLVSRRQLAPLHMPAPEASNGIVYIPVNIAVDPQPVSVVASRK